MNDDRPPDPVEESSASPEASAARPARSLPKWPILLLLAAAVVIPAVFWQRVWFGSHLSDEEIRRRLTGPENPRRVQHACEQISRRMQQDPEDARQFYDLLTPLAEHDSEDVRCAAAWCMGEDDTRYPPFRRALLGLLADDAPRVRYNAALAMARFGDPAARPVLQKMLDPCPVPVRWENPPEEGVVVDLLQENDPVQIGMQLALIDTGGAEPIRVIAPLDGRVDEVNADIGRNVRNGDLLCTISPGFQQVFSALRALTLVGQPEDVPCVERYLKEEGRFSPRERARLQAQAQLAADAIRSRQEKTKPQ